MSDNLLCSVHSLVHFYVTDSDTARMEELCEEEDSSSPRDSDEMCSSNSSTNNQVSHVMSEMNMSNNNSKHDNYICHACGAKFNWKQGLKSHINLHTDLSCSNADDTAAAGDANKQNDKPK